jgi:hypothetical protein
MAQGVMMIIEIIAWTVVVFDIFFHIWLLGSYFYFSFLLPPEQKTDSWLGLKEFRYSMGWPKYLYRWLYRK